MNRFFAAAAIALVSGSVLAAQPAPQTATGLTLAQFEARQRTRIMAKDSNGDGRVSLDEFQAGEKSTKGDPVRRFQHIDANHDGFIDVHEIDAMSAKRFQRLDTNGDGVVTAQERAAAHRPNGEPGE